MTVSTRSSSGGTGAQSKSTKQGLSGISKKSKHTHGSSKPANETVRSGRKSGKRNVPSTDSDGEDADDELHPTDCSPPLKRRRKEARPLAGRRRSKSKEGSECDSPATDSASVPGKSGTNRQRVAPKRMPKRDKEASTKSGISTGSKTVRPHDPSGSTPAIAPDQVDELSSSLSELTTSDGSPLPLPALPLPPAAPPLEEHLPSVPQKDDDNSIIPASEPESVVPASQADSAPLASQCSSIVPASVSGSSQVMDVSCTQEDAEIGVGDELVPVTQPDTTQATTSAQQNGLTQEALESFSMEESLPRSAMDTQASGEAAGEQDRLSYVTDEDGHENVPPAQEDPPAFGLPLFHDGTDWQHAVPNDGFIPPAPVMKDLDVFSQSQPYSSQGGTQRDQWTSSSQMSIVSSGGQVSPNRPTSFRYPLLPGSSSNDAAQRQFPRFESPFAQNVGTSRAVPNTKRNFALGVDALQFDEPGQVPSLAFPPPFPPPQSSDPSVVEHPSDAEGEHEIVVPDDQHYQQL